MDQRQVDRALKFLAPLHVIKANTRIQTKSGKITQDTAPWFLQPFTRSLWGETCDGNVDDVTHGINDIFQLMNTGISEEDKACGELQIHGAAPMANNLQFRRTQTRDRQNLKRLCDSMQKACKGLIVISETYDNVSKTDMAMSWRQIEESVRDRLVELEDTWKFLQFKYGDLADCEPLLKKDDATIATVSSAIPIPTRNSNGQSRRGTADSTPPTDMGPLGSLVAASPGMVESSYGTPQNPTSLASLLNIVSNPISSMPSTVGVHSSESVSSERQKKRKDSDVSTSVSSSPPALYYHEGRNNEDE